LYGKYPQLFLLIRIVPLTLYNLFIFVLTNHPVIGVIGVGIFNALDMSMNNLSREIIFNYSSLSQKDGNSSIGVTRLFEQIGKIVALIIGGYLLDFNKTLVLILSLSIYAISVIPLVLFYIKSRKQKTFNKDATSNAMNTLTKDEELKKESKRLTKKLLLTYFCVYFAFAFVDLLQTTFSLLVFYKQGEFATAGIINAVFNTFYAIGFYVAGKVNEKYDTTKLVIISCVIITICSIALPFIPIDSMLILVCIVFGLIAFFYTFISLFVLDRMLLKSRIMGCSNKALYMRETGCVSAYILVFSFGFIDGPITGLISIFIATGIAMFSSAIVIPTCEEKTRQHLVDYLQNNEKMNNKAPNKSKAKRIAHAQSKSK
jgi:MFS family permease